MKTIIRTFAAALVAFGLCYAANYFAILNDHQITWENVRETVFFGSAAFGFVAGLAFALYGPPQIKIRKW